MRYFSLKVCFTSFVIVVLFLLSNYSFAQSLSRNQTIAAYIYNFAKNSTIDSGNLQSINILVISDEKGVFNELSKICEKAKINNKTLKVNIVSNLEFNSKDYQFIFISQTKNNILFKLLKKVDNNVLVISENHPDKSLVMINLYDSGDSKILFEINMSNIDNNNITINDEILLLGGSLIEVASLYKKSQKSLIDLEKEISSFRKSIDSLTNINNNIQSEIFDKNNVITNQEKLITNQKNELAEQELKAYKLQKELQNQLLVYKNQKDSIKKQSLQIKLTIENLDSLQNELILGKRILNEQVGKISNMDIEIEKKSKELLEQDSTISKQRTVIFLFVVVILLILILTYVLYRAYKINMKKNELLNKQKQHINNINYELQSSNEELKSTNEELNSINEELSVTLEQLNETQSQLFQSEKMASLGVLTAGVAHEMNNPINFVYAGVNSLKKDLNDLIPILNKLKELNNSTDLILLNNIIELKDKYSFDEAYKALVQTINDIEIGAERTAEIVRGLSNFSRIEKEEVKNVCINFLIDETLILLKNKYKANIEIIKEYSNDLKTIDCFYSKISQAILNLLSNAIDAINEKGIIKIITKNESDNILISIQDSGVGIPKEIIDKIYDPFFTTKKVGKGVGLGLAISYRTIEEHNGTIECKSEIGKGTIFNIKLPINRKPKM